MIHTTRNEEFHLNLQKQGKNAIIKTGSHYPKQQLHKSRQTYTSKILKPGTAWFVNQKERKKFL